MTAEQIRQWRHHLGLSQSRAAEALGIGISTIRLYEAGWRSGRPVAIPRSIELACAALALGVRRYGGPQ